MGVQMTIIVTSVCALFLFILAAILIARRLPIHSLAWSGADRIEISDVGQTWKVVLTDPQEIAAILKYGESGHRESMLKCGSQFHLSVTRNGTTTGYYVHGSSLGPLPGGLAQTIFVPRRKGLLTDLRELLARHGHVPG